MTKRGTTHEDNTPFPTLAKRCQERLNRPYALTIAEHYEGASAR